MITASDARALGAASDYIADNYLRIYVEPKITAEARAGKSSVFYMVRGGVLMRKGEMLSKAILIATLAHEGQYDKGGKPYILHPLTVLHKLKTDDEEVQCAAVLHDVVEDCSGKTIYLDGRPCEISFQMLSEVGMTPGVIDIVWRLTKMPGQTYEQYQAEVLGSIGAMLVKREDLRTNSDLRRLKSRAITEKDVARVAKYMAFYALIESKLAENG